MAKKPAERSQGQGHDEAKQLTLKELLTPEMVNRLKSQASDMKAEQEKAREEERRKAEAMREAERKRNESSMEYLLENSSLDWKKYK